MNPADLDMSDLDPADSVTVNGTPDMHAWTTRKQQKPTLKDLHLLHLRGGAQVQTPTQSVFPQTQWL